MSAMQDHTSQAEFAAALLDARQACPGGLHTWNGSDPAARLAVYRNNVVVSLVDALAAAFPVVQRLVGETFFRAMAGLFVRQQPPRTKVLAQYGAALPQFLAGFEPAQSLPYLADVARLEVARLRAYHAADAPAVAANELQSVLAGGGRIDELRLLCHPSVSTLSSRFAIVSLWAAHQRDGDIEPVNIDAAESAIVLRDGLQVLVLRAPPGAANFVAAIQQGMGLGSAAAAAKSAAPDFDLTATLSLLLDHGALSAIRLPAAGG